MTSISDFLGSDEPGPFKVQNPLSESPILLVCDHASDRFPKVLGDLGLDPFARRCHLAVDIGAGKLTETLAAELGVTAVLARYSRLVVDCNRELMDPSAFLQFSDGVQILGNRRLTQEDKERRAEAIYRPYHRAVAGQVERLTQFGEKPSFIAVHSFTPVMDGIARPWHMGVLWDTDARLRDIFLQGFADAGFVVGDNEPYSGKAPQDYTIDHHAESNALPHVGIEIRQDLIDNEEGVRRIADVMRGIIATIPERLRKNGASNDEERTRVYDRS